MDLKTISYVEDASVIYWLKFAGSKNKKNHDVHDLVVF